MIDECPHPPGDHQSLQQSLSHFLSVSPPALGAVNILLYQIGSSTHNHFPLDLLASLSGKLSYTLTPASLWGSPPFYALRNHRGNLQAHKCLLLDYNRHSQQVALYWAHILHSL